MTNLNNGIKKRFFYVSFDTSNIGYPKERENQFIICYKRNIIFGEFLLYYIYSLC